LRPVGTRDGGRIVSKQLLRESRGTRENLWNSLCELPWIKGAYWKLEVGRLTDKPNRYPIFYKTETDTDFGILKTGKYRIPTKNNRKNRYSRLFSCLLKPLFCLCFTIHTYSRMCKKNVLNCAYRLFFHLTVTLFRKFWRDKFHPEILMGCPRAVASNKV